MIAAIKFCLKNLANFRGRDARSTYWWYLLFLFVVQIVAGFIISLPMLGGMFSGALEAAQSGADPQAINQAMAAEVGGSMRSMMLWSTILALVLIALYCAAGVRRLQHSAKPGLLVLLVIAPLLYSTITAYLNVDAVIELTVQAMQQADPANTMAVQRSTAVQSLIGYAGYLAAIIIGFLPTSRGANAYGEEPVSL